MSQRVVTARRGAKRLCHDGSLSADTVAALLSDPARVLASGVSLKDGDRSVVRRVTLDGRAYVLKHYLPRGVGYALTHLPVRSRALRCWIGGRRLAEAAIRTPVPVALIEQWFGAVRFGAWLLQPHVDGTMLDDAVLAAKDAKTVDDLAHQLAALWNQLGSLRAVHDDLKAANFLVDGERQLWVIDLDGLRFGLPGPLYQRARLADLESHFKSWRQHPEVARRFANALAEAAPDAIPLLATLRRRKLVPSDDA